MRSKYYDFSICNQDVMCVIQKVKIILPYILEGEE